MKTFKNQAAQGDCFLRRITAIPANAVPDTEKGGADIIAHIIAHSETGHNHVIERDADNVRVYAHPTDALKAYLEVLVTDVELKHLRSHDTHETLIIPPGRYEIRRQREYQPEGWRRAAD